MIRKAVPEDAASICEIYNHYVENTAVTFETEAVPPEEMERRISAVAPMFPWFVYLEDQKIRAYAYASKWRERIAYRYTVESTVYVSLESCGKGLGKALYARLLEELYSMGIHSVIGGIALPNPQSQRLHENLGFKKVAHFHEAGYKFDRWIDVAYWELLFDTSRLIL
jgi:L-amino acid N-acyltransferase YncA